jgi:hypothetical protein
MTIYIADQTERIKSTADTNGHPGDGLGKFARTPTKLRLQISVDRISHTLKICLHKKTAKLTFTDCMLRNTVCVAPERRRAKRVRERVEPTWGLL